MIRLLPDLKIPMEPIITPEPFDSVEFIYQVKWDGVRILAAINDTKVSLINKHMRDKTEQYPEMHQLAEHLKVKSAVLDGELVVLKDGKPSFPSVMSRDQSSNPQNIKYMKNLLPINYMVFDLLYLDGKDLRHEAIEVRQAYLDDLLLDRNYLHRVDSFPNGKSLFASVEAMGMEGIVAKKKGSPYSKGKHHTDWLKVKCLHTQVCLLGGYTLRGKLVNSLLLGAFRDGKFTFIGKAANGLTTVQQEILSQQLPPLQVKESPFANLSSRQKYCYFVRPQIGMRVEFLEWTEAMSLRHPVIKDFIDISPENCTIL
jgi:bifunctional non-homologous end joining protein LigD